MSIFKNYMANFVILFSLFPIFLTKGCSLLVTVIPATGCQKRERLKPEIEAAIDEYRGSVPEIMKKGNVPGAAIALVDDKGIIWTEGFGYTSKNKKKPVTPETLFAICSMSKRFVATAVMLAVQDGLVKLDVPITTYLPDFTVNSRYEANAGQKITLRHLLSHTSGLTRDATIGNPLEPEPIVSFEQHIRSIYHTWLLFPVGKGNRYSNVGVDLAAYIIQVASGMPYGQYLKEKIFDAVGMHKSTTDSNQILSDLDRAIGNQFAVAMLPEAYMMPSGNIYSSAEEIARFIRLQLGKGTIDGRCILDESFIDVMNTPHAITYQADMYEGFGIAIDKRRAPNRGELFLWHDGGGFGFRSVMYWYPEYNIGAVVLTSRYIDHIPWDLAALTLTDRLIESKFFEKQSNLSHPECNDCPHRWDVWLSHEPTPYKSQWRKYCGDYHFRLSGYEVEWWATLAATLGLMAEDDMPCLKVYEKDDFLCLKLSEFLKGVGVDLNRLVDLKLQEYEPGLFFAPTGVALDFRGEIPTWQNYRLEKKN
jgi:CubicO group peptidase (beta-lactamase class C family)